MCLLGWSQGLGIEFVPLAVIIGLILNPVTILGFALGVAILRYLRASSASDLTTRPALKLFYGRLRRVYRIREYLGRIHFNGAVLAGHYGAERWMRLRHRDLNLSSYDRLESELSLARQTHQTLLLRQICSFVYSAVLDAPGDSSHQTGALDEFLMSLCADKDFERVGEVVRATYLDGRGSSSTLTSMMNAHFVSSLSPDRRSEVLDVLNQVTFVPSAVGWYGHRILEAVVYMSEVRRIAPAQIVGALSPSVAQTTERISAARTAEDLLAAKWSGRTELLRLSGLEAP